MASDQSKVKCSKHASDANTSPVSPVRLDGSKYSGDSEAGRYLLGRWPREREPAASPHLHGDRQRRKPR